jgi:hypothetical protein
MLQKCPNLFLAALQGREGGKNAPISWGMQKCPNLFLAALQGREGFIFGRLTGQLGLQKCPNLFLAALQGREAT